MAVVINSELEARLSDEDKELSTLEQQMRDGDSGDPFQPNTNVTESKVDSSGETQHIDGSGQDVTDEDKQEAAEDEQARQELEQHEERPKKVRPWSELRRTKKAKEELEKRAFEAEKRAAALERELQARQQPKETQQQQVDPVPEFTKDPIGNLKKNTELTQKQLFELNQRLQVRQLQDEINADEENFSRTAPDYTEARDWLLNRELDSARTMFRALPEAQREQYAQAMVNQRRTILIATAKQTGESVAKLAYELARAQGFTPKVANSTATNLATKANTPDAARERVMVAKEKELAARASLGGTGQSPEVKRALSRSDIMSLSEAEMDKLDASNPNWADEIND